jgi:hypothetical protein
MQADQADDLAANDGDQDVVTISAFVQKFTNRFEAAVRQLQRVADGLRCGVTLPDSFGVRRFRFAYGDVHIQPCSTRIARVPIYFPGHVHYDRQHDEQCDRTHQQCVILLAQSDIEKCVNTGQAGANH